MQSKQVRVHALTVDVDFSGAGGKVDCTRLGIWNAINPFAYLLLLAVAAGRSLSGLVQLFPKAVDLLLGDKAMPAGVGPVCRGITGKEEAAASFVYTAG
jgi:hypothetical protein